MEDTEQLAQDWHARYGWIGMGCLISQTVGQPYNPAGWWSPRSEFMKKYRWRVIGILTPEEFQQWDGALNLAHYSGERMPMWKLEAMD